MVKCLNEERLKRQIIEYLTLIFRDFSVSFTDKQIEEPFFRFQGSMLDRKLWYHYFNDKEQLIVSLNIDVFSKEDLLFNMMHLLIHEINKAENVIDISSKSRKYHVKNFRLTAEKLGVKCVLEKNFGFLLSEFTDDAKEIGMRIINRYYDDFKESCELLIIESMEEKLRYKKNRFSTYQCPICHKKIKASDGSYVLCGLDGGIFEKIE